MSDTVSPLAPQSFPQLPPLAGVALGTLAAGLRYQGRDDLFVARQLVEKSAQHHRRGVLHGVVDRLVAGREELVLRRHVQMILLQRSRRETLRAVG